MARNEDKEPRRPRETHLTRRDFGARGAHRILRNFHHLAGRHALGTGRFAFRTRLDSRDFDFRKRFGFRCGR